MKKAAINMLLVRRMNNAVDVVCTAPYQTFAKHPMNFLLNNRACFSSYSYVVSNICWGRREELFFTIEP